MKSNDPFDAAIKAIDKSLVDAKIDDPCPICQLESAKAALEAVAKVDKERWLKALDIHAQECEQSIPEWLENELRDFLSALPDGPR